MSTQKCCGLIFGSVLSFEGQTGFHFKWRVCGGGGVGVRTYFARNVRLQNFDFCQMFSFSQVVYVVNGEIKSECVLQYRAVTAPFFFFFVWVFVTPIIVISPIATCAVFRLNQTIFQLGTRLGPRILVVSA